MSVFIINDQVSGALLPLANLVERMRLEDIAFWRFRDVSLSGHGLPFGMNFDDFESASREIPSGFEVSDDEFRMFLESDFQIIDGEIEAWSNEFPARCVVRLDCEDASQWEITSDLPELFRKLEGTGFTQA